MSTRNQVLLGVLGGVVLCAALILVLPSSWNVERSVVINAARERVHMLVEDLHYWERWAQPEQRDPSVQYGYSGPEKGAGAEQSWTASGGEGFMRILESDPNTGIRYESAFLSDKVNSVGSVTYSIEGDQTRVTWQGTGDVMPVIGGLFLGSIEAGIHDFYRHALGQLRQLAEEGDSGPS